MTFKKRLLPLLVAAVLSLSAFSANVSIASPRTRNVVVSKHKRAARKPVRRAQAAGGATAECRDGSYSFSANHRGTCSHHGGVKRWFK